MLRSWVGIGMDPLDKLDGKGKGQVPRGATTLDLAHFAMRFQWGHIGLNW